MSRKPKPTDELPDDHKQTLHLLLYKADLVRLDKIVGQMKRDPRLGPMRIEPGREKAALYAIARCAENGPERITSTG